MKRLIVLAVSMVAGAAWGQNDLPLTFKGICVGSQTDIHYLSAIQATPAIKCDALTVMQIDGQTVASFSNGDPKNPVLMFSGDLFTVNANQPFDPYMGPISSAFPIDHVLWGDGTPVASVHAGEHSDKLTERGCYFHFLSQGWAQLSEVECELAVDTPNHRPRRVTVTFKAERKFIVDGRPISVEYGTHGANSFHVVFNDLRIDGTCGTRLYQIDGVLKHTEPGTPIERLFKAVCYKDASDSQ